MTSRSMRARLDRIARALGEQRLDAPVCRFHGTACRLGLNWPLQYEEGPLDDLLDLMAEGRRKLGMEIPPHPRDLWATDRHEQVPQAELDEKQREADELLAAARAHSNQLEAEICGSLGYDEPPPIA